MITRYRGDTNPETFSITDENGAVNITGRTFTLTVDPSKAPGDDTNNILQLSGVIVDGPGGLVAFTPTEIESEALVPGGYWFDIEMTTGSEKLTIVVDKFKVLEDITKS